MPPRPSPRARTAAARPAHAGLTVGCVITTYESAGAIEAALTSVLAQTRPFSRILVCDDASSDETVARARAMLADLPHASVVRRERNLGPGANRDLGIRALGTDLFTQLDGDDWFDPEKNAREMAALRDPRGDVAFCDIEQLTARGAARHDTVPLDGLTGPAAFAPLALRATPVPRDMLLSVDLYRAAGGYEAGVPMFEDWSLKLRLCLAMTGAWRHAPGVGTHYDRRQPGLSQATPVRRVYWRLRALGAAGRADGADPAALASGVRAALTPIRGALKGLPGRWIDQPPFTVEDQARIRGALAGLDGEVAADAPDARHFALIYGFLRATLAEGAPAP